MTISEVQISQATPKDAGRLLSLVQALARHHDDVPSATEQTLAQDIREVAVVLMALEGDAVLGYAAMLPLAQMQFGVRGLDVHHLFVTQTRRGAGIGRALFAACEAYAVDTGCRYVSIGTHPDNLVAQAVYRAWGLEAALASGARFRRVYRG